MNTTDTLKTKTLLIGLGKGGSALLPYLLAKDEFDLVAVCDSNIEAVGVAIAKQCGLTYYHDAVEAVNDLRPELAVDTTGDPSLAATLYEERPAGTSVVTGEASRLLWELLAEHEAQRRWESRFNRVLDDMHSAMLVVQDAKIKFCNRAFHELLGYSKRDILGFPYANIIDTDFRERDAAYYQKNNGGEKAPEEYDTRVVGADGSVLEVQIRSRLSDWEGRPARLIIMSDVTELRRLQREREQFFRYMVHELRAPLSSLNSVISAFNTMDICEDTERAGKLFGILRRSSNKLSEFVNDFLELSKIEKQQINLKLQTLDPEDIINEEVEEQKILAEDKGLELTVQPWESFKIEGDDFVIRTAVRNLVNNAVKYTEEGSITVSVKPKKDTFAIIVSDTGAGLTDEEKNNIFQDFGRIHRTEGMKGTGLGLALVKKLTEAASGGIRVQSDGKEKGAAFTVELPYKFKKPQEGEDHAEK